MLGPVFDKIATQYKNRLKFGKIDIDQFSRISEYERISAIPELIIYENGKFEKSISKWHCFNEFKIFNYIFLEMNLRERQNSLQILIKSEKLIENILN